MSRQEEAVRDLEAASQELIAEITQCRDEDWHGVAPDIGWTRAAIAMHCATGNDVATAWMAYLVSGREVLDTPDFHHRMNDQAAERHAMASREEAIAAVVRSTERAAHYLRSLTDDELDRTARLGVAGADRSPGRFLANFARHVRDHTGQMKVGLSED